ncbi:MAG: PEGA domain-containing protein [Deltaproteobacteria bacterium]|nr:PEGA domain-containing protein [Deltaproteobacteria bacterium]
MTKLALLASALALAGCATLTGPRAEVLNVTSDPPGAEVLVNGVNVARAPASVELDRTRLQSVTLALPGYAPQACNTRMAPGPGYLVSDTLLCVLLFPFGCVAFVDASGAWNQLEQPNCYVRLNAPAGPTDSALIVPPGAPPYVPPPQSPPPGSPPPGSYPPPPPPMAYPPPPPPPH